MISSLVLALGVLAQSIADWTIGPYAYDGAGNITSIGPDSFTYDEFGRVKSASVSGQQQQFTYDRFGNLRTIQTGTTTIRLGADAASNRLSVAIESFSGQPANAWATYDAAGQLMQWNSTGGTFSYDAVGMLTSSRGVPGDANKIYIYTPNDERIAAVTLADGRTEWTLRDASGKVLRRLEQHNDAWLWRQDYIYLNGQLLASEVDGSEKTLHYFLDHLGTPRLITNNGGVRVATHTYLPFGGEITPANQDAERMKYTGHERDPSGLDSMHARYYSAVVGRFLSVDPALDVDELMHEPQLWNRYSYVGNNPLKFTDPDGRERLAYWHFHRQPVPDRGFKTEMIEMSKTAAIFGGALVGPALASEVTFEASLLLMRNPATVLAAMKLLDAMGGNTSSHINTTGLTGGKHGYLVDNATKSGFFRGVMGLTEKTIGAAMRSHFVENFAKNSKFNEKGLLEVTGRMVDAKGRAWSVTTVWQWVEKTKSWALVTADDFQKVK